MRKDPLPPAFVEFLRACFRSNDFRSVTRLHRGCIIRWSLWQDGNPGNAIPGYATCPPESPTGFPAGWTIQNFRDICREVVGTAAIRTVRHRASRLNHA